LLSDHDDQRRPAVTGVGDRVDGVAETGRGVQVDERRLAAGDRVTGGHPHDGALVQAEHELDVGREVSEEVDLGGARIAEDPGQSVPAHHVKRGIPDGSRHAGEHATTFATRTIGHIAYVRVRDY
jgi:hypothetical protein